MTSAATPAAGSAIASTLLAKIPGSLSLVPGEVGNGFSMLGGDWCGTNTRNEASLMNSLVSILSNT